MARHSTAMQNILNSFKQFFSNLVFLVTREVFHSKEFGHNRTDPKARRPYGF